MLEKETKYLSFSQYNSPFEDIHLLVKEKRNVQNMLFDLGDITKIPNRELLKIRHIFITHFHMDHFIGLSQLIRVFLSSSNDMTIHLYGPAGLIEKVSHTIAGFSWNLLDDNSFKIALTEVDTDKWSYLPPTVFHKIPEKLSSIQEKPVEKYLYESENLFVEYILLEHKILVLGYKIVQKPEIHFLAQKSPYPLGSWIKEAKKRLLQKKDLCSVSIPISSSKSVPIQELKNYFQIYPPENFVYLTDFLYKKNKKSTVQFARYADILFIENHFIGEDAHLAKMTYHLSSIDVKEIIALTKPKEFVLCHFSRRYIGKYQYKDFLDLLID